MSEVTGKFIWHELMTTDTAGAEAFYTTVTGWSAQDSGLPGMAYTVLSAAGTGIGGMMALPAEALARGARPGWMGYIAVPDVDAHAERVAAAGGAVHKAPGDIPGIGRFAVVADPQGAIFILFKPSFDAGPPPPAAGTPGLVGWNELHAVDGKAAFDFYAGQFGWTKGAAFDMGGSVGIYQLFATGAADVGGMMTKMPSVPAPVWLYYINVAEIDAAVARVNEAGGQVLNGPNQVPGGSWIVQALDPQGAMFALVGPRGA